MPEPPPQWSNVLQDLWRKQSQWSKAADAHKKTLRSWNGPLIGVGFIGVVISMISPYIVPLEPEAWTLKQYVLTVLGPLLVTGAALLTREILGPKQGQQWIAAREISEALKAEGYIFAAAAPPYSDVSAAPPLLAARVDELIAGAQTVGPLPPPVDNPARPHQPLTTADYISQRVDGQRETHIDGARGYVGRLRSWRGVAILLMLVSAGLGAIAGLTKQAAINVWIAVVSTALATVTAYVAASRFEFLAASYAATAERLEGLVRRWRAKQDPTRAEADRFVLDCEAVLAAQNRTWGDELSKRVSDKLQADSPPPPAPQHPVI
jgi:hypothetical protein